MDFVLVAAYGKCFGAFFSSTPRKTATISQWEDIGLPMVFHMDFQLMSGMMDV